MDLVLDEDDLSAPERLALLYARADLRDALGWLLRFDRRLCRMASQGKEPLIAQMRLAWWRDNLTKPVSERPKGEPMLGALSAINADGMVNSAIMLVDAWELLIGDPNEGDLVRGYDMRAEAIFGYYARWAGCSDEEQETAQMLGKCWTGDTNGDLTSKSRNLRPLSILSLAAQLERRGGRTNGIRLIWHALTGR
jgi:15-cis-phytoene synthase